MPRQSDECRMSEYMWKRNGWTIEDVSGTSSHLVITKSKIIYIQGVRTA